MLLCLCTSKDESGLKAMRTFTSSLITVSFVFARVKYEVQKSALSLISAKSLNL